MSRWQCINCGKDMGQPWTGNGCPSNGGGVHVVREVKRVSNSVLFNKGNRTDVGSIICLFLHPNFKKTNLVKETDVSQRNE